MYHWRWWKRQEKSLETWGVRERGVQH